MVDALPKDPATLAALHPARTRELQYGDHKNSLQLYGSQLMVLKRPTRLPESGREYVPGDPVNLIDWKTYGRLGQLIIREVRDPSTSRVLIGVDASATMRWPTSEVPQPVTATKIEVALRLALHLAHQHLRMGDQVEIRLLRDDAAKLPELVFKPRRGSEITSAYEHWLDQGFDAKVVAQEFLPSVLAGARYDRVFWLGDGLGAAAIDTLVALGKKSMFIHVLSSLELSTDWFDTSTSYFDQDMGQDLREYQGPVLKQGGSYQTQVHAWCEEWRRRLTQDGHDYLRVTEETQVALYQTALEHFIQAARAGHETGAPRR